MKKILIVTILCNIGFLQSFAQAPQEFKYQTVLRDDAGEVLENQSVDVQIDIRQTTASGTIAFTETHSVTSSLVGLINLTVGRNMPYT